MCGVEIKAWIHILSLCKRLRAMHVALHLGFFFPPHGRFHPERSFISAVTSHSLYSTVPYQVITDGHLVFPVSQLERMPRGEARNNCHFTHERSFCTLKDQKWNWWFRGVCHFSRDRQMLSAEAVCCVRLPPVRPWQCQFRCKRPDGRERTHQYGLHLHFSCYKNVLNPLYWLVLYTICSLCFILLAFCSFCWRYSSTLLFCHVYFSWNLLTFYGSWILSCN